MKKSKYAFMCAVCEAKFVKYQGFCSCGARNSLVEAEESTSVTNVSKVTIQSLKPEQGKVDTDVDRYLTHSKEFDRVLGGGLAKRSFVLISGDPGKGKSTLLLQASSHLAINEGTVLYITGEESANQVRKRRYRLGLADCERLFILHETRIQYIEAYIQEYKPDIVIIDSIQTTFDEEKTGEAGSVSQIGAVTNRLNRIKENYGVTILAIGHVTKGGELGGPRLLEHMVDTYLHLEGEKYRDLRMLYAVKNRNGSTDEMGVFQMKEDGLEDVSNPSKYLLSDRLEGISGSAVVCVSHHRPLLVEVQALVTDTRFENAPPRTNAQGFDRNRVQMLLSVLDKRANRTKIGCKDVIVNVVGGMKIDQPGADLAVAIAIYSSETNQPIDTNDHRTVILGELGLGGEVRPVSNIEPMMKEIEKVGYTRCILPQRNYETIKNTSVQLIPVKTVMDTIKAIFKK
ncbi:DNA repair protein RadA [Bacillus cereus]|uniref:DNA repair protein RadA n=1 Tax=Bacillus cereus TaxID=1396 RepID=UPI0007ABF071|nr:DNA repair protein RadA [Bacillus cereus]